MFSFGDQKSPGTSKGGPSGNNILDPEQSNTLGFRSSLQTDDAVDEASDTDTANGPDPDTTGVRETQSDETADTKWKDYERKLLQIEQQSKRRLLQQYHAGSEQPAVTWKILYYVKPIYYLDEPRWEPDACGVPQLRLSNPIPDIRGWFAQHSHVPFAIIKRYDPYSHKDYFTIEEKDDVYRVPEPTSQVLSLISKPMIDAVEQFVSKVPGFRELFPTFNPRKAIPAPYLFMYYSSSYLLSSHSHHLDFSSTSLLLELDKCINQSHGWEHGAAKYLASEGRISNKLFGYLIRPGDVLVKRDDAGVGAYMALDWATESEASKKQRQKESRYGEDYADNKVATKSLDNVCGQGAQRWYGWTVPVWSWTFDGVYLRQRRDLDVGVNAGSSSEIIPIPTLDIIPLEYADPHYRTLLEKRGRHLWLLQYEGGLVDVNQNGIVERCMIDIQTHKKLHPKSDLSNVRSCSGMYQSDPYDFEPMSADSLRVFPPRVPGFNLMRNTWVDLEVDHMSDVTWNKRAIADLVIDKETKELVQALVMTQLGYRYRSVGSVPDSRSGLTMLLHGESGTGKTFTAESVAEFAEAPLLRVNSGDIGTTPEIAKKNLQSFLHLGWKWNCVVLLDEVDVFLEAADEANRPALVSILLRELENYKGVLIMTATRIGAFDKAFKSRIQLSLHYENLGLNQRREIWRNFLARDKSVDESADYKNMLDHLDDLSKIEMNGHEIKNAIRSARQLAMHRSTPLTYSHLSQVLWVSKKGCK